MDEKHKAYVYALLGGLGFGLLLFGLIYSVHTHLSPWQLNKTQAAIWETVLKAVAGYVAVLGAVITAFKYIDEKARARLQDLKAEERQRVQDIRDDRKDYLKDRQDVYKRLGTALADIMNHDPDDPKDIDFLWPAAKRRFYKIYWGEIRVVADDTVMALVETFSDDLFGVENSGQKEALAGQVKQISIACRDSLKTSFTVIRNAEEVSAKSILTPTSDDLPRT